MKLFKKLKKIKKFYQLIFSTLLVFGFLGVGFFFGIQSWDKQLYVQVHPSKSRNPASANKESSLYSISLEEMNEKAQTKLFKNTKIVKDATPFRFYLGNFLVPSLTDDGHQFVCQAYSVLETTFVALDVTLNGEEGLMVVQSPCLIEDDAFIGPISLPLKSMRTKLDTRSFALEEEETLVRFYNISFQLASDWLLVSVRFFNSPEDRGLVISYHPNQEVFFQMNLDQE